MKWLDSFFEIQNIFFSEFCGRKMPLNNRCTVDTFGQEKSNWQTLFFRKMFIILWCCWCRNIHQRTSKEYITKFFYCLSCPRKQVKGRWVRKGRRRRKEKAAKHQQIFPLQLTQIFQLGVHQLQELMSRDPQNQLICN